MIDRILQDQVVLMVGAGRKPAPELAAALADQGAVIAANDLSPVMLDPLAETIRGRNGRVKTYIADATRGMPLRAMLDEVLEDWGRIDILINNPRVQHNTPLLDMDEWDWQRTIEMNLNGPYLVTQLVAKMMKEQGQGTILNLVDNNLSVLESPGRAAYAASQQGLLALSQAAARELIAYNIHVHTLCPDETLLYADPHLFDPQNQPASSDTTLPGSELIRLAVFLCGPEASQLTGQVYQVSRTPQPGKGRQE